MASPSIVSGAEPHLSLISPQRRQEAPRPGLAPVIDVEQVMLWGYRARGSRPGTARARAARLRADLAQRHAIEPELSLVVSLEAGALDEAAVRRALGGAGETLDGVVLELCGALDPRRLQSIGATVQALRERGARVAVGDAAGGHASLGEVLALRPDLLTIGGAWVREIDRDPAKAAVAETLGTLASRIGARLLVDDVARDTELDALVRSGVSLACGPLFGGPEAAARPLTPQLAERLRRWGAARRRGDAVGALVEHVPALRRQAPVEQIAELFLADPRHGVIPLIDDRGAPVALVDRAAFLRGEPDRRRALLVVGDSPIREVARRALTRPAAERFLPLVCCDAEGRYTGVVRVERVFASLAA